MWFINTFLWEIFAAGSLELKKHTRVLGQIYHWQNTKNMDKDILDILK